jgi:hypothetical protein
MIFSPFLIFGFFFLPPFEPIYASTDSISASSISSLATMSIIKMWLSIVVAILHISELVTGKLLLLQDTSV